VQLNIKVKAVVIAAHLNQRIFYWWVIWDRLKEGSMG